MELREIEKEIAVIEDDYLNETDYCVLIYLSRVIWSEGSTTTSTSKEKRKRISKSPLSSRQIGFFPSAPLQAPSAYYLIIRQIRFRKNFSREETPDSTSGD